MTENFLVVYQKGTKIVRKWELDLTRDQFNTRVSEWTRKGYRVHIEKIEKNK